MILEVEEKKRKSNGEREREREERLKREHQPHLTLFSVFCEPNTTRPQPVTGTGSVMSSMCGGAGLGPAS